jgi:hypothetical protein
MTDRELEFALRDLGGHLAVPQPSFDGLTESVLARLDEPAPPGRRPLWLKVAAAVVVLAVALGVLITVSPPVRAAVLHLLRFAGIEFSTGSAPPTGLPTGLPTAAPPLPGERVVDLATARRESSWPVLVPAKLGEPQRVLLADGTPPRVVSLQYRAGTVRLDQFDGGLDLALYKKLVQGQEMIFVSVGGETGLWVDRPHEVIYVDRAGEYRTESARLSGKTLIWQHGTVTLRLEGELTLDEALEIAGSVR